MQKARIAKYGTLAGAITGFALLFAAAAPATAHSFLIDANPSAKDHVAAAPKTIKLKFGAGVEPNYSTVTIEGADGKVLASGAVGKPETPRELTLDAPADLPPARYIVRYRVLSTDGHIVEGNYEFTIDGK
ncbi:MAG TPA: copper resistance CopC family protein [Methylocystis sp.]|nr:copper resistance CopC family protein [Methylocystis sp.]